MSASKGLHYHDEIRRHFRPCPEASSESEGKSQFHGSEDESSNAIVSNTTIWNNIEVFDDKRFPAANLPSTLDDEDIKNLKTLFMIPDSFFVFKPKDVDKIYDFVSYKGCLGVGISVAAFECGFRVPMHPFLDKVLDTCDAGLGQLTPNSFLNINTFIARCFDRGIEPNIDIFWSHYQLSCTSKCLGFYSIGRKNASQKWSDTRTNNKGFYENWFFLIGPNIDNYAQWSSYTSKEIPKKNPELDDLDMGLYLKLKNPHSKSMILPTSIIRSEDFLVRIKVSGIGMSEAVIQQRYRAQKLAQLERKRKDSNKSKVQKSDNVDELQIIEKNNVSKEVGIVATDASFFDAELASPPKKKSKTIVTKCTSQVSKYILESSSSASIALGKKMCSSVTLLKDDEEKLSRMNSVLRGEEVMALASQMLLWSHEQVAESRRDLEKLSKLEVAADAAEDRATSEQQKASASEARLKKLEAEASARESQLKDKISSLEKQLQEAEDAKLNAEANWYGAGLEKRLQMVKEAKMDVTKCMFDYELELWKLEQDGEKNVDDDDAELRENTAEN